MTLLAQKLSNTIPYALNENPVFKSKIKLLICSTNGPIIRENKKSTSILYDSLIENGISLDKKELLKFKSANKNVIDYFVKRHHALDSFKYKNKYTLQAKVLDHKYKINKSFEHNLLLRYISNDNSVELTNKDIPNYFNYLRTNGIKVALITEYSHALQDALVQKFNLDNCIDAYAMSNIEPVKPDLNNAIYDIMSKLNIFNTREVCTVGCTKFDILKSIHANVGLIVSILSSNNKKEDVYNMSEDLIIEDITNLDLVGFDKWNSYI